MRRTHPIVFLFLIVPFGAMGGYLSVAIGYQLTQAGVSVEQVAGLDGWAHTCWLEAEAAIGVVGIIVFVAIAMALPRRVLPAP